MIVYQVPKEGLNVPFRDGLLKHVAQDIFKLAKVWTSTAKMLFISHQYTLDIDGNSNQTVFISRIIWNFNSIHFMTNRDQYDFVYLV